MKTKKVELKDAGLKTGQVFSRVTGFMKAAATFGVFMIVMSVLPGNLSAGEALDINGGFAGNGKGWHPNKPGHWDAEGRQLWNKIPDTDKNSLSLASKTKPMHICFGRHTPFSTGDTVVIKAMVKGKGAGFLGIYYYPAGGFLFESFNLTHDFEATNDWIEVSAKITMAAGNEFSIVLGVESDAVVEFKDITAELEKK